MEDAAPINAGYMVLEPEVFSYIGEGDQEVFEGARLSALLPRGS